MSIDSAPPRTLVPDMSDAAPMPTVQPAPGSPSHPPFSSVRVLYPDLHGVARGKDVPVSELDHAVADGLAFCSAVMGTDLRHTPVWGGEEGYPDLIARPDLRTLRALPWEPGVGVCLADLSQAEAGLPFPDPRGAVRRGVERLSALGFDPIVGPELEFFLLAPDATRACGFARRVDNLSMVYTVGAQADPGGVVRRMAECLNAMGLQAFAANHEFMNSQYEINLRHSGALDAADRAFLLKAAIKDMAAHQGLHATFMGKPFNDQGGSGTHFHLSLNALEGARAGANALADPAAQDGVSDVFRWMIGGLLVHARALMALLNPTVNAYRRIQPDSLAPTHANWGWDNRSTFIRIPPERGAATRVELRVGDGAANPYLATAAILAAAADGLERQIAPPAPVVGDAYRADPAAAGDRLPLCLDDALTALAEDSVLTQALGPEIVETFLAVKGFELERHRAWVSDWELSEYLHHL